MHVSISSKAWREIAVLYLVDIGTKGKSFITPSAVRMVVIFCRPGRFRFIRFENSARCMHARRYVLALANSCLVACVCRTLIGAYLRSGFARADCAVLCCVVLAARALFSTVRVFCF